MEKSNCKITTYKDLLQTLLDIEVEKKRTSEIKFIISTISILFSIFILVLYICLFRNYDWSLVVSSDYTKYSILPIIGYIYMSIQEENISNNKMIFYKSLCDLYLNNSDLIRKIPPTEITNNELKDIVLNNIKEYLNDK